MCEARDQAERFATRLPWKMANLLIASCHSQRARVALAKTFCSATQRSFRASSSFGKWPLFRR